MSHFTLVFIASLLTSLAPFACCHAGVLKEGEVLQYKVSYGFLRLGTLQIRTTRDSTSPDRPYHVAIISQSSASIPFVHMKEYSECMLDASTMMSRSFFGKYETSSEHDIVRANYDDQSKVATYSIIDIATGAVQRSDTLRNVQPHVHAPSMLFYARANADCGRVLHVPTLVDGMMKSTTIDFTRGKEFIDIDANSESIRTHRYEIHADYSVASNGLTGGMTGWLSDDDAAVPVKCAMKIVVGSITLELEKWNRPGWVPPTGEITQAAAR